MVAVETAAPVEGGATLTPPTPKPARRYEELTDQQRKTYKMELTMFQMTEKINDRIAQGIRVVDAAIKASARTYIPPDRMESSVREILQLLANRYKRSDDEITEQLFEQLQQLKLPSTKGKVESWVAEWKNMRNMIIERNMEGIFGSETIFVKKFLKAGRTWAPNFCDNWVQQKRAAERSIEFFQTTRQFRLAVEESISQAKSVVRGQANSATLQEVPQDQEGSTNQKSSNQSTNRKNNRNKSDDRDRTCVCEKTHLFKLCPYIHTSNRPSNWKEDKKVKNAAREKIRPSWGYYRAIKTVTNTDILDGITEASKPDYFKRNQNNQNDSPSGASGGETSQNPPFSFANTAFTFSSSVKGILPNPLYKSVIYDSGAAHHLTWDKSRFVEEITPTKAEEWVATPTGDARVHGYGTMLVKGTLNGASRELSFPNTRYAPDVTVTLISANILKEMGFY